MDAVILVADDIPFTTRICGMPLARRLLYTLRAAGIREVFIATPSTLRSVPLAADDVPGITVGYGSLEKATRGGAGHLLLLDGDVVLDERIVRLALVQQEAAVLYDSEAVPAVRQVQVTDGRLIRIGEGLAEANGGYVGVAVCPASWLAGAAAREEEQPGIVDRMARAHPMRAVDIARSHLYVPGMRRALKPFWCRVRSPADANRCKNLLVDSAQKGTLDVIAWYVHRPVENWIVRHIADLPVTPNQISALTSLTGFAVAGLFLSSRFLPGTLLALAVNVMDGLDGKLARVKGLTSSLGELEHSFDCLYEQAWYAGFAWGLYRLTDNLLPLALATAMLLCDSFARHVSMQFKQVTGVSLADYAPFDRAFRRFDGRRNTYSLHMLLAILIGRPALAAWSMGIHALLTASVYAWRAATHLHRIDLGHCQER